MNETTRRRRKVKIVATLGPSSTDKKTINDLFDAGADVFRLNLSHGTHGDIKIKHSYIREIESLLGRPICIMADLQGPKLRCGLFKAGSVDLVDGQLFSFDLSNKSTHNENARRRSIMGCYVELSQYERLCF